MKPKGKLTTPPPPAWRGLQVPNNGGFCFAATPSPTDHPEGIEGMREQNWPWTLLLPFFLQLFYLEPRPRPQPLVSCSSSSTRLLRKLPGLQWAYQNTNWVIDKASHGFSPSQNLPTFTFIRHWVCLLFTSEVQLFRLKSSMQWICFIFCLNQWLLRKYIVFHLFRRILKQAEAPMPSY